MKRTVVPKSLRICGLIFLLSVATLAQAIPQPKDVLGFTPGDDRKLANWSTIVEYFQKLDANAGVGYRIIQQAHRQEYCESILAYYALSTSNEPISHRKLRRRCERIVREAIGIEIDFRVEPALATLRELELINEEVINDRKVASLRHVIATK